MKPIRSRKLYQEIAERIRQLLMAGDLRSGDKLPSERELAQMLNVSRTSVRDALRTLEGVGLVEIRRGDGAYLRKLTSDALVQPLISYIATQKSSLEEIFEARKLIEPEVAALAAERAKKENVQALETAVERQSKEVKEGRSGEDFDTEFHFHLAQASSNPVVLTLMTTLIDLHQKSRAVAHSTAALSRQSLRDHQTILQAIRNRQSATARKLMLQHLHEIEQILTKSEKAKHLPRRRGRLGEQARRSSAKGGRKR